jgi:hypothetical protein
MLLEVYLNERGGHAVASEPTIGAHVIGPDDTSPGCVVRGRHEHEAEQMI